MSINLNGRVITVVIRQNTGDSTDSGAELDISGFLTSVGEVSWTVDENLTKLDIGNMSLTVSDDETGTVWNFLRDSIAVGGSILPPWCYLTVDGVMTFIGIIKESPIQSLDAGSQEIQINAVTWSSMLESKRIQAGQGSLDRRSTFRNGAAIAAGSVVTGKSVYNKELRRGHDRTMVAVPSTEQNNFKAGDWVYVNNYSSFSNYNKLYPVEGVQMLNVGGLGVMWCIYLGGGFWWQENPGDNQNFGQTLTLYRAYMSTSAPTNTDALPVFTVAEDWTASTAGDANPKTSIKLTYTDGLLPGDKLDVVTNFMAPGASAWSITLTDVDTAANVVYLDAPLSNNLVSGVTSLQLQATSLQDSVLMQVLPLVATALAGLGYPDFSTYIPPVLPAPCFSFISPKSPAGQNAHSETLAAVSDIQATLTGFEVLGNGKQWTGLPTAGWDVLGAWTKTVSWTSQLAAAPARTMPYAALPGDAPAGAPLVRHRTRYPGLDGYGDDPGGDPGTQAISYKEVYDYSNFRRYLFAYARTLTGVTVTTWNGSTWTTVSGFSTTGVGLPMDIVSMPGTASSVGSGNGLLAIYKDGTVKTILSTVSLTATLPGDALVSGVLKATLVQTSNGIYYCTPSGYGTIRVVAGALECKWRQLIDLTNNQGLMRTITPMTPFVYANGEIIALAKVSYKTSISDARFIDDTYLLQLTPDISTTGSGIISADFIVSSIPRATLMLRSPVSQDVFGVMGSRLFQVATRLPDTVDRFTSTNQTATAILEFVAAMTNSVAIPLPSGILKFYSRGFTSSVTNLVVDVVSTTEARWNKHLADCVVIKGFDSCVGVAVSATQKAGLTISYSNETWIRNSSQARAIAQSYLAFFEKPRHEVEQEWYSEAVPMPFEGLAPMQVISINGGATHYYLTGLTINYETCTAKASLLEVV
jgi:hypothetical protein